MVRWVALAVTLVVIGAAGLGWWALHRSPSPVPPPAPVAALPPLEVPDAGQEDDEAVSNGGDVTLHLAGVVLLAGKPAKGAKVTIDEDATVTTDAEGRFEHDVEVERGPRALDVEAELGHRYAAVSFHPEHDRLDLRLELQDLVPLRVTVRDERGQPVKDCEVTARPSEPDDEADAERSGNLSYPARTDGLGGAVIELLPGRYDVDSSCAENVDADEGDVAVGRAAANRLTLVAKRAALSGTIVTRTGAAVDQAELELTRGSESVLLGEDNPMQGNGRFRIDELPAGDYTLSVKSASGRAVQRVHVPRNGLAVVLGNGTDSDLSGQVVDERGEPVPYASVVLLPPDGYELVSQEATTDVKGRFLIAEGSGKQKLVVLSEDGNVSTSIDVELGPHRHPVVKVVLPGGKPIRGHAVDSAGRPLTSLTVCTEKVERPLLEWGNPCAEVDRYGAFSFDPLGAGKYRLDAHSERWRGPDDFVVEAGDTDVKLVMTERPSLRGRVVNAAGAPVASATVEGDHTSRPDGRFQIWHESSEPTVWVEAGGLGDAVYVVTRNPAGPTELGDVMVSPARLTVKVVDALGRPLPGVKLSFWYAGAELFPFGMRGWHRMPETDSRGEAEFPRLVGAGLSVVAEGPGVRHAEKALAAGATSVTLRAAVGDLLR